MVKKCHFLTILQGWHFDELCPALSMIKVVLYREVKKVKQIESPTIPKFRTYRRVFLFHQNLVADHTKIQDIHEGLSFSP